MPDRRYLVAAILLHVLVGVLAVLAASFSPRKMVQPPVIEAVMLDPTLDQVQAAEEQRLKNTHLIPK